ncbi:hypothetical protein AJ79_05951 [Helicocarpus griseus UAMH5409]|uniref:Uncharacterized protein n=1 Tax=Helicocarpus griseus UAMH5409 TaxID=1447875 RepID=A0A2B7XIC6_9EURO|nr:hypothetical protein AJ79_05951 [Helicocarpus griseus UAMH5409]
MTILPFLLLPLGSLAAPQLGGGIFDGIGDGGLGGIGGILGSEPMTPESVSDLEPKLRPGAKRTLIRWGPYKMAGYEEEKPEGTIPSMDPNGEGYLSKWKEGICHDCTVLGGVIGLQMENGTNALDNGVYIHHILSFDRTKKTDSFVSRCPTEDGKPSGGLGGIIDKIGGLMGTMFVGVGEDNGNDFKIYSNDASGIKSGFHIGPDDEFFANIDLVNYNPQPLDVFVTMDIEFVDGKEGFDAYGTLLDVGGCSMTPINTDPNGPVNTTSEKFPILADGAIVSAIGHLHAGGEAMVLAINDQERCVSQAEYGETSSVIAGMSQCLDPIQVVEGDYLTMTAIYDLKAHPGSEGGGDGGHGGHGGQKKRAPQEGGEGEGEGDGGHGGHMGGAAMGMFDIIFALGAGEAAATAA